MNYFKEIVRGIFIGIANIIPGVSGGTMAVSMGIYDKIISAVTNLRKDFKNSVKTLLPYLVGMVLGIAALSLVIEKLFDNFPIPTTILFLGLILGGVPILTKKVEKEKFKWTHLVSFAIFVSLIIFPTVMSGSFTENAIATVDIGTIVILFVLGIISAGTMVVPGVSGSMMLMMLGYYKTIIATINLFIKSVLAFDMANILYSASILVPFGIGIVIGIFITAKIIEKLLKKYPNATYWGIIGLVVASPFAILFNLDFTAISIGTAIASIITFAIGYIISNKLSE